jgi:hypothetical protein
MPFNPDDRATWRGNDSPANGAPNRPYYRYEWFAVYGDQPEGTFQITVSTGDSGYIFARGFQSREAAAWTCGLLNAAIGRMPDISSDAIYEAPWAVQRALGLNLSSNEREAIRRALEDLT